MKTIVTACLMLMVWLHAEAAHHIIATQAQFDKLDASVKSYLNKGEKDIVIDIQAKSLTFHNRHLVLDNLVYPTATITIQGNGVQCTGEGEMTTLAGNPERMYLKNREYYNPWSRFYVSKDTIQILDAGNGLCRVRRTDNLKSQKTPKTAYIQFTCSYSSKTGKILSMDRRWIYFKLTDGIANINLDYKYGKCYPRYRVMGLSSAKEMLMECHTATFLRIHKCQFKALTISGINFAGSDASDPLLEIIGSKASHFLISDCQFEAIEGKAVYERASTHVWIKNNRFSHLVGDGIRTDDGSTGCIIENNIFTNCPLGMKNTFAIMARSQDFLIKGNRISDFCNGGIGVGIWGGSESDAVCSGTVADNELFLTDDFAASPEQNSLMDSGAIYVWTRTDGIQIRGNYIHNINGLKDNRGIFCDDGTRNVTIIGNTIEHIYNSYDIDLRWCDDYKEKVPDHNKGNVIRDNKTTGKIRFEH